MFIEWKTQRARAAYDLVSELEPEVGETVTGRGFTGLPNSRRIAIDANTIALLHPGCRVRMGWVSTEVIQEVIEVRDDCRVMEVLRFNQPRLQANIFADDSIELHRFEPGGWERVLNLKGDGDTIALLPQMFADSSLPIFQAWLEKNPRPAH